jgi:hypothetical protein
MVIVFFPIRTYRLPGGACIQPKQDFGKNNSVTSTNSVLSSSLQFPLGNEEAGAMEPNLAPLVVVSAI